MIFRPNIYIKSFKDLDIKRLKATGVKLLIVDIDNTLVPSKTWQIDKDASSFISCLQQAGIIPVIISNNVPKRVAYFAKILQIDHYAFSLKPLPWRFKQIQKKYHVANNEVMIIGDQLMTDVLFAKSSGIGCILVDPIIDKDNIFGTITRAMENVIRKIDKFEKGAYYDKM